VASVAKSARAAVRSVLYLEPKAHDGTHGEAAVGEFLLLVGEPPAVRVVHELRRAEEVAGHVPGTKQGQTDTNVKKKRVKQTKTK